MFLSSIVGIYFTHNAAYMKGLPLPRLPVILSEKTKRGEGREGEETREGDKTPPNEERIHLEKSNILLLGPTGSGEW